nr:FCD domain-containing protein [Rhodococcus sp. HNM0569]
MKRIEDDITTGRLTVGSKLPAERAFAEELGVSRSSVREALRILEAMGLVKTAVGSGPGAGAVIASDPAASLSLALRLHVAARTLPVEDIVQTRVLLETWAVDAAARTADLDLTAANALLDAMDDPSLSPEEFHRIDAEFHVTLAGLAGNVVVREMMASLREAIRGYVMVAVPKLPDWGEVANGLRREHRAVVAALDKRQPGKSAAIMRDHILGYHALTHPLGPDQQG